MRSIVAVVRWVTPSLPLGSAICPASSAAAFLTSCTCLRVTPQLTTTSQAAVIAGLCAPYVSTGCDWPRAGNAEADINKSRMTLVLELRQAFRAPLGAIMGAILAAEVVLAPITLFRRHKSGGRHRFPGDLQTATMSPWAIATRLPSTPRSAGQPGAAR